MNKNPKISVIIPNYNHARYLDERINSVLKQTCQDFELIILDDCSPDNGASKDVIEKYRDNPHVSKIVYNDINSGYTFKQWHKGIELARGELIWIAESDDTCKPELLETLLAQFVQNPLCVLAYCISIRFNDDHEIISKSGEDGENMMLNGIDFIKRYMGHCNSIWNASSVLFRKETAKSLNKQYENYKGAGDRLFWIEIAEKGEVAIVNKALNYQRWHAVNSTKHYNSLGINQMENKKILDYIWKKGYLSTPEYYSEKIQYSFLEIVFWPFEDENVRKKVIKYWNLSRFDIAIVHLYRRFKILKIRIHSLCSFRKAVNL